MEKDIKELCKINHVQDYKRLINTFDYQGVGIAVLNRD